MLVQKTNLASFLHVVKVLTPGAVVLSTLFLSTAALQISFDERYLVLSALGALLAHIVIGPVFNETHFGSDRSASGRLLTGWLVVIAILLLIGYATKTSDYFSRRALFIWIIVVAAALLAAYAGIRWVARRFMSRAGAARTVAVAGINEGSLRLAQALAQHPEVGMRVVGFFEDRGPERYSAPDVGVAGRLADLPAYLQENRIDVIFIAVPMRHVQRIIELLDKLHDTTASIYFLPDVFVFDLIQSRVQSICGLPAVALCETPFFGYRGLVKRAVDILLASVGLVILAPLLLVIAVLVRISSPGSALFRQRRYGLDGSEIVVYKFRTMYVAEDGSEVVQATRGDARITPIGAVLRKYSLDELPQLINVIQGRMSLVGPRPHAVAHNEEYRKLIKGYMIRHKVQPGITGWAQVNGLRGETSTLDVMRARVEFDLDYLRNWSLWLDLRILFKTVWIVAFKTDRAY